MGGGIPLKMYLTDWVNLGSYKLGSLFPPNRVKEQDKVPDKSKHRPPAQCSVGLFSRHVVAGSSRPHGRSTPGFPVPHHLPELWDVRGSFTNWKTSANENKCVH